MKKEPKSSSVIDTLKKDPPVPSEGPTEKTPMTIALKLLDTEINAVCQLAQAIETKLEAVLISINPEDGQKAAEKQSMGQPGSPLTNCVNKATMNLYMLRLRLKAMTKRIDL